MLTQLRRDIDQSRLPLIILASKKNFEVWEKLALRYPNTWVEPESLRQVPEQLKNLAEVRIAKAGAPSSRLRNARCSRPKR